MTYKVYIFVVGSTERPTYDGIGRRRMPPIAPSCDGSGVSRCKQRGFGEASPLMKEAL